MTDVERLVERMEELRLFLNGEGELDGLSFGEAPPPTPFNRTGRRWAGRFWWRDHMRSVLTEAASLLLSQEGRIRASVADSAASVASDLTASETSCQSEMIRDPTRLPARDLTNEEIVAEIERVGDLWDDMVSDEEFEGHGGSPGEWMHERLDELDTEKARRLRELGRNPRPAGNTSHFAEGVQASSAQDEHNPTNTEPSAS